MERFVLDDPLKQWSGTKDIAGYVDDNGCWICDTYSPMHKHMKRGAGYYKIVRVLNGKQTEILLHRYVYANHNNCEIPSKEVVVRHKCDNPLCINPDHLETGTVQDNSNDMVERGRSTKGEKSGVAKLTDLQRLEVENLLREGKESLTNIAKAYMISIPKVHQIKCEMQNVE